MLFIPSFCRRTIKSIIFTKQKKTMPSSAVGTDRHSSAPNVVGKQKTLSVCALLLSTIMVIWFVTMPDVSFASQFDFSTYRKSKITKKTTRPTPSPTTMKPSPSPSTSEPEPVLVPTPEPGPALAIVDLHHVSFDGMLTADGVWVDVNIGTPAQSVALLFDLGSSVIAAPPLNLTESTDTCQICPEAGLVCQYPQCINSTYNENTTVPCVIGYYEPERSSTLSYLSSSNFTCHTRKSDSDRCPVASGFGSVSDDAACQIGFAGDIAFDMLSMGGYSGNVSLVPITTIQSGFQDPPVAGIMGVAFARLANLPGNFNTDSTETSFVGVVEKGKGTGFDMFLNASGLADEFSMCMGTPSQAGKLVLGGIDHELYSGDFQYVEKWQDSGNQGFYGLNVNRIEIGGKPMPNTSEFVGSYVDSGNPYFNVPNLIEINYFLSSEGVSCSVDTDCNIGVVMDGNITLDVPDYVTCNTTSNKCNMITSDWILDDGDAVVFGYAVLRHYVTHFERVRSLIGFAEPASACSRKELPKLYKP